MVAQTFAKTCYAMLAHVTSPVSAAAAALAPSGSRLLIAPVSGGARSIGSLHRSGIAYGHGSHSSDNDPNVLMREKERNLTGE
jgi:hypothetical protein